MNHDPTTLILNHLDLAKKIAISEWSTATHALEKDEMLSLANYGLVDAAQRWAAYCEKKNFDPSAVQYFQVFARLRIRGTIRDKIRKDDHATRTLRSKSKKLKDAGQDEGLSHKELSAKTGMTESEIRKVNARIAARPFSLDSYVNPYGEGTTTTDIKDLTDTEGSAFSQEMMDTFVTTFDQLDENVKVILALHYYAGMDFRKIAEELSLPETKVSQLHCIGVLAVKDALATAAQERG